MNTSSIQPSPHSRQSAIARLVEDARRRNPGAMRTLARIGEAARWGDARAIEAVEEVTRYTNSHPIVPVRVRFAGGDFRVTMTPGRGNLPTAASQRFVRRAPRRTRRARRSAARVAARAGPEDGDPEPSRADEPRGAL